MSHVGVVFNVFCIANNMVVSQNRGTIVLIMGPPKRDP